MHRKSALVVRTVGACLFCFLFSSASFSQNDKTTEYTPEDERQPTKAGDPIANFAAPLGFFRLRNKNIRLQNRFSDAAATPANFLSAASAARASDFSAAWKSSLNLRRRGGVQHLLSSATGITQTGESSALDSRLLVSSNGQRPTSNNFSVDGLSVNFGVAPDESSLARNLGALPALTASGGLNGFAVGAQTQELTIRTMGGVKEQRVGGADITIATRSGNNTFHGAVFENFGDEIFNANDFFANSRALARADARLNQFGGALGGYLWRDKAWFFGGYDGLRLRQAAFNVSEVPSFNARANAPDARLRTLFAAFPVSPNGAPETSNGFSELAAVYTNPAAHDTFGLRIDAQPIRALRLGGRYNFAGSDARIRGDRDFSLNTVRRLDTQTDSLSAWAAAAPTPDLIFDARVSFSRHRVGQEFSIDEFGGAQAATALFSTPFDFLKFDFAGKNAALAAGRPLSSVVRQFQASGRIDWSASRHFLTFGADFRRLALEAGAARTERNVLFERTSPNFEPAAARVFELTRNISRTPEINNFSLYAQDNFSVSPRLNVTFGLRWDADFAPETGVTEPVFRNAAPRMPDRTGNFAPRAAVTFALFDSRAVIRAGAGLYYDYGTGAASDAFANSFPFASGAVASGASWTSTPTEPLGLLQVFDKNLRTPRAWHVFAEFQQEIVRNHILTATLTASRARTLFLTRTFLNADPNFNYIRLTGNDAEADFDSLELRFERRFSQGFSFNTRYALAQAKDNFSPDALRETNFVADDLQKERGAADFDVRHQLTVFGVYDLPALFVGGWARRLTEDWSISAFANARTAFPLTVGYYRVNDFGREFVRADRVANAPGFLNRDTIKTLNPAAFAIPPVNRQGSGGRNSLRGFPFFQLDASLQKRIRFSNETRLEISINAYNLLNNTNFADMSGNLGTQFANGIFLPNAYFGKPVATFGSTNFTPFHLYGGARTIRFGAKFVF